MSSTRDNVSLYNNSQDNMLSYIQNISYSHIGADNQTTSFDFIDNFTNSTSDKEKEDIINQNFKWLELQLLKNHRQISAFDYYKIDGSFSTALISTADLLKNHSLICTKPSKISGEQYVAGDLLYKENNGQIRKIELGLSGIYIPTFDQSGSGFQIEWNWLPGKPDKPEDEPKPIKMEFAQNNYYGREISKGEIDWPTDGIVIIEDISKLLGGINIWSKITPVVKGYHKGEEVFWDYTISLVNNNWKISNIPNYVDKIMVK